MTESKSKVESGSAQAATEIRSVEAFAHAKSDPTLPRHLTSKTLPISRFLFALIGYVAVSTLCANFHVGALSPSDFRIPTWTSCAIEDLSSTKTGRPKIEFVGSSLVLAPLLAVEANYTGETFAGPRHHRSHFFEAAYKKASGQTAQTFNFAVPGEMPSDACLITKFLLKGDKRPDVLVYGLGPRDFLDNILPSPASTDPYAALSRFGSSDDRVSLLYPDWQQRLNVELGHAFYLYRVKEDIITSTERATTKFMAEALPCPVKPYDIFQRRTLLPSYRENEVGSGECIFKPTFEKKPFLDNIGEYRKRYKKLKWDTYLSQMRFLGDLLNTARERQIHVVIVSMPITQINHELMQPQAWDLYRHGIKVLAAAKGATYIDAEGTNKFAFSDFGDTVHLNEAGGRKLFSLLAERMAADKPTLSALQQRTNSSAGATTVAGLKGTAL